MIVQYVGNEGCPDKANLRNLLQNCIVYLENEPKKVWKNATIRIYDDECNSYEMVSGNGKHKFICQMKNGKPLTNPENQSSAAKYCIIV